MDNQFTLLDISEHFLLHMEMFHHLPSTISEMVQCRLSEKHLVVFFFALIKCPRDSACGLFILYTLLGVVLLVAQGDILPLLCVLDNPDEQSRKCLQSQWGMGTTIQDGAFKNFHCCLQIYLPICSFDILAENSSVPVCALSFITYGTHLCFKAR